jgi:tRNA pseudouridine synthase 9
VVEEGDEVIVDSHPFSAVDTDVCASQMVQKLWVHCPIGVLSHRDGIHVCHPNGKSSLSQFSLVGYDKLTDTSLIVCVPLTGRTHQLRLHLELIGNPIANDPCYGGELFYGDEERRRIAYEHASTLESIGHIAQSRIPHLNTSRCLSEEQKHKNAASVEQRRNDDETDDEYLIRTCRFCQNDATTTQMEHSLHCDGIWLHALQYSGNGWQFRAPLPDWASPFNSESIEQIIQSL